MIVRSVSRLVNTTLPSEILEELGFEKDWGKTHRSTLANVKDKSVILPTEISELMKKYLGLGLP